MTNPNKENRELSIDELNTVSGGDGIRFGGSLFPSILTKQPTSNPTPTKSTTSTTTTTCAPFDPVTIRF